MAADVRLWDDREEHLVRFLLGDLPAPEQGAIEDRLFDDRGFLDEILAVGDDLIDAYLSGSLSPREKVQFETHFLASPRRRERFEFVRDVVSVSQQAGRAARPARLSPRLVAAAAAVLIAAAVAVWRPWAPSPIAGPATPTVPPTERARIAAPETQVVHVSPAERGPVDIALSDETKMVEFQIPVTGTRNPTFEAALLTADGKVAWEAKGLVPRSAGAPLAVELPSRILVADAYDLEVRGERLRGEPRAPSSQRYQLHITRR
jgi:hypothetical protein